jgi:protein SCO1/2
MLIFFGFTHCPDICPAELQVNRPGPRSARSARPRAWFPIFITLDPERDTPEAMG